MRDDDGTEIVGIGDSEARESTASGHARSASRIPAHALPHDSDLCGLEDDRGPACPACRAVEREQVRLAIESALPPMRQHAHWLDLIAAGQERQRREREECLPQISEATLGSLEAMHVAPAIDEVIRRIERQKAKQRQTENLKKGDVSPVVENFSTTGETNENIDETKGKSRGAIVQYRGE